MIGGFDLVISRTGYTGEKMAFELLSIQTSCSPVQELLKFGEPHGLKPCGLGSRDSLRTEADYPSTGMKWVGSEI